MGRFIPQRAMVKIAIRLMTDKLTQAQIKQRIGAVPFPSLDFADVGAKTILAELDLIVLTIYNAQFGISAVTGIDPIRVNFYVEMARQCCKKVRGINPENIIPCVIESSNYRLTGDNVDLSQVGDYTAEIEIKLIEGETQINSIKQIGGE